MNRRETWYWFGFGMAWADFLARTDYVSAGKAASHSIPILILWCIFVGVAPWLLSLTSTLTASLASAMRGDDS